MTSEPLLAPAMDLLYIHLGATLILAIDSKERNEVTDATSTVSARVKEKYDLTYTRIVSGRAEMLNITKRTQIF